MVFKYFSFLTIWYYYKLVQLSGHLLTAYGYGAPEFESGIYTHQSDVYSLGVVMLELLTGRQSYDRWECKPNTCHPFSGFHPVSWFMYSKHLGQDTHSRGTVSSKMGNSPTSWHWCVIKYGWSFSQWRIPGQIIVKLRRHYFSMCSGKLIPVQLSSLLCY